MPGLYGMVCYGVALYKASFGSELRAKGELRVQVMLKMLAVSKYLQGNRGVPPKQYYPDVIE